MNSTWEITLAICAVTATLVTIATLVYAIISGRKQAEQLSAQTNGISTQTELLRKQLFGEVYEVAQIKDLQFYLPERRKHCVDGFENFQKESQEVALGKEVRVKQGVEAELHIRFWTNAPQGLRAISFGFLDNLDGIEHEGHPTIPRLQRAFVVKKTSQFQREIYVDWHGNWHMEFPFSRFFPKNEVMVLCFMVKGENRGKFPLYIEIRTREAKNPYREILWVEVGS